MIEKLSEILASFLRPSRRLAFIAAVIQVVVVTVYCLVVKTPLCRDYGNWWIDQVILTAGAISTVILVLEALLSGWRDDK